MKKIEKRDTRRISPSKCTPECALSSLGYALVAVEPPNRGQRASRKHSNGEGGDEGGGGGGMTHTTKSRCVEALFKFRNTWEVRAWVTILCTCVVRMHACARVGGCACVHEYAEV